MLALALAALAAAPADPTAEDYRGPSLPLARVTLKDAFGAPRKVEVEVAATTASRTRGMMWRRSLAPGKGMLFIFPRPQVLSFWMKNCFIPLDMIFITEDLHVLGIVEEAQPGTTTSRHVGPRPSRYVLEVPGGWARKVGLLPGSPVVLEGVAGVPVE